MLGGIGGTTTEDEMAGWHYRLDGCESGWTPGVGDGQGGLACCHLWGRKESDKTERLNWTEMSDKSSNHPSSYKVISISATVFLMLHIKSSWLIYLDSRLCFLTLFTYFIPSFLPVGNSDSFSVSTGLFSVSFVDSTYKWYHMVFVILWLTSLSMLTSNSINVIINMPKMEFTK